MEACEKYQELISRMVDGELDEAEKAELEAHIASCPECAALYRAFASVSQAAAGDMTEPPAELKAGVMAAVGKKKKIVRVKRWKELLAVAACLALVIAGAAKLGVFGGGRSTAVYTTSSSSTGAAAPAAANDQTAKTIQESPELAQSGKNSDAAFSDSGSAATAAAEAVVIGPDGTRWNTADEDQIAVLAALLLNSGPAAPDSAASGSYQVTLPDASAFTVTVCGDVLVCTDLSTGESYTAAGSTADFTGFLNGLS